MTNYIVECAHYAIPRLPFLPSIPIERLQQLLVQGDGGLELGLDGEGQAPGEILEDGRDLLDDGGGELVGGVAQGDDVEEDDRLEKELPELGPGVFDDLEAVDDSNGEDLGVTSNVDSLGEGKVGGFLGILFAFNDLDGILALDDFYKKT